MVTPQPCCHPNPAAPDRIVDQQFGEAITAVGHSKQTDFGFTVFFLKKIKSQCGYFIHYQAAGLLFSAGDKSFKWVKFCLARVCLQLR